MERFSNAPERSSPTSSCTMRVPLLIAVLTLLACAVPATVTGIVVSAIDFLLNDHIPSLASAFGMNVAQQVRSSLLDSSTQRHAMILAMFMSHAVGWNTTSASLDQSWIRTERTRVLSDANHALQTSRSLTAQLTRMVNQSSDVSVMISIWKRLSPSQVNITRLACYNSSSVAWTMANENATCVPFTVTDSGGGTNSSGGIVTTLSVRQSSYLVSARVNEVSQFQMIINPVDASVTRLVPLSQPSVSLSGTTLYDGIYLEVFEAQNIRSIGTGSTLWDRVAAASVVSVATSVAVGAASSSSPQATVGAAIAAAGLFHTPSRTLVSCVDFVSAATSPSGGGVIRNATVIPFSPNPDDWTSWAASNTGLSLAPLCATIGQFLSTYAFQSSDDPSHVSLSLATGYSIVSNPLDDSGISNATATTTFMNTSVAPADRAASDFLVVTMAKQDATETSIVRTRGQIAVIAIVIAAMTTIILIITIRLMTRPLGAITEIVNACASLHLSRLGMMETSIIAEIADIQKSLSYLAIRLYHYLKFLPDKKMLDVIATLPEDEMDDYDPAEDNSSEEENETEQELEEFRSKYNSSGHRRRVFTAQDYMQQSSSSPVISNNAKSLQQALLHNNDEEDDDIHLEERLHAHHHRKGKPMKSQMHVVQVHVLYESRHLHRNTLERFKVPNKSASFLFKHRSTDPVLTMLKRQCREQLREHPGETLVLYAGSEDTGMRQLITDNDVLYAFEAAVAKNSAMTATNESSTAKKRMHDVTTTTKGRSSPAVPAPLPIPSIQLVVRKGTSRSVLPLLIAAGTFLTVGSRFVLSVERLAASDTNTQLLGLLLLGCLAVQIAQNSLICIYLVRRFRIIDKDFRQWAAVSTKDIILGVVVGSLNVTNLEVMGCHVRLTSEIRLSAPITSRLRVKISKYSFVGFIVGDLLPFVFILINIVLAEQYRNALVLISLTFSVLSVSSILVSHGILQFVVLDEYVSSSAGGGGSSSSAAGGGGGGGESRSGLRSGGPSILSTSLLLTRREVTVVQVCITEEIALFDLISIPLMDGIIEKFYEAVQVHVKHSGGLLLEARGLVAVVAFNAHAVVPDHPRVAFDFFSKLRVEVEKIVLTEFFGGDRLRQHVASTLPANLRQETNEVTKAVYRLHAAHRCVASIITDEMAMGYVGTLTAQTFQRVGFHALLAEALCNLNSMYGSTLLVTREVVQSLSTLLIRRLDELVLSTELCADTSTVADTLDPYVAQQQQLREDDDDREEGATDEEERSTLVHRRRVDPTFSSSRPQRHPLFAEESNRVVEVYEIVIHNFLPLSTVSSATFSDPSFAAAVQNVSAATVVTAASAPPHHQLRRRPSSTKSTEAVRNFSEALEVWRSLQNISPLVRHLEVYPEDFVAKNVFRWVQFLFAPNRDEAICTPRMLSTLGLCRHVCETPPGYSLTPSQEETEADRTMVKLQERMRSEQRRLLRPPRSERRSKLAAQNSRGSPAAATVPVGAMAGSSNAVIEQMLAADKEYHVSFL